MRYLSARTHYGISLGTHKAACGRTYIKLTRSKTKVTCLHCRKSSLFKKAR